MINQLCYILWILQLNMDPEILTLFLTEVYFQHSTECKKKKERKKKGIIYHSKLDFKCFNLKDWNRKIPNLFSAVILALESVFSCSIPKFRDGF